MVTVLDRKGLEAHACECYGIISSYFDQFLNRLKHGDARVRATI